MTAGGVPSGKKEVAQLSLVTLVAGIWCLLRHIGVLSVILSILQACALAGLVSILMLKITANCPWHSVNISERMLLSSELLFPFPSAACVTQEVFVSEIPGGL